MVDPRRLAGSGFAAALRVGFCCALVAGGAAFDVSHPAPARAAELGLGIPAASETADDEPGEGIAPTSPAAIEERLAAIGAELAETDRALASPELRAEDRPQLEATRDLQKAIERTLVKQLKLVAGSAASETGASEPSRPDPSIFALNDILSVLALREQRREMRAADLVELRAALQTAKERFAKREKERRQARAARERAKDPIEDLASEHALRLAELASRSADERVKLRTLEIRAFEQSDEPDVEARLEAEAAKVREAIVAGAGSRRGFDELVERSSELRRRRQALERELATYDLRFEGVQQRFARGSDPRDELLAEVEALSLRRETLRQQISLIDAALERAEGEEAIWRYWEAAVRGSGERGDWSNWKDELQERAASLDRSAIERAGHRSDLELRLSALQARLAALPEDSPLRVHIEAQRAALSDLLAAEQAAAADLVRERDLADRVLAELRGRTGEIDPVELIASGVDRVRGAWAYEITAVDDAPITVGSLALALLLAGTGLWISRRGAMLIGDFSAKRFGLDTGASHALQTLSFYVLLVSFTLLALRAVHFPLTAFTVLGGALAIGVGFGSQNVMNNFISGLILMLERPVRAGDVIEVDGNHGAIERIGARSTQIRAVDGRHIIVPNSFFLESNVVNWTLSDDLIRTQLVVGVIYGSPTRLVETLIRQALDEDPLVLPKPKPIILFDEFGDNSLNFVMHFWVRARSPMETRKVQSGLRFRIDELFREHDLVIAFPQRDVHLDSVSPIEVRVVDATGAGPSDSKN